MNYLQEKEYLKQEVVCKKLQQFHQGNKLKRRDLRRFENSMITLLSSQVFNIVTTQTNLDAPQYILANLELPSHSRCKKWKDVSIEEMAIFISLYMLTGMAVQLELKQYWSIITLTKTFFSSDVCLKMVFNSFYIFYI